MVGDHSAPVTVTRALPQIIDRYVRPGKLKIAYRSLEDRHRDRQSFQTQQVAALGMCPACDAQRTERA